MELLKGSFIFKVESIQLNITAFNYYEGEFFPMSDAVYFLFPFIYVAINAVSFALYGLDKYKARTEKWRISEKSLLVASLLGPIGAWLGMTQFRHKTQKPLFRYSVPAFIGLHLLLVLWINL
jgi:uncharacterized membrane protein YsdA (DUF1294 family)